MKRKNGALSEEIANLLEYDILSGVFPTKRLPTEQALVDRYSVSRTVIREALKLLTERGLITSVVGSGSYITKPDINDLTIVMSRVINTHDIDRAAAFDVRSILEPAAAFRAASLISNEALAELEKLIEDMSNPELSDQEVISSDLKFHMLIAKSCGNELLHMLIGAMSNVTFEIISMAKMVNDQTARPDVTDHRKILRALKMHDPKAAESMMFDHLFFSRIMYRRAVEYSNGRLLDNRLILKD